MCDRISVFARINLSLKPGNRHGSYSFSIFLVFPIKLAANEGVIMHANKRTLNLMNEARHLNELNFSKQI